MDPVLKSKWYITNRLQNQATRWVLLQYGGFDNLTKAMDFMYQRPQVQRPQNGAVLVRKSGAENWEPAKGDRILNHPDEFFVPQDV